VAGDEAATGVVTKGGRELKGDLFLVVAGVRPNVDFARSTAIEINRGIVVDGKMETGIAGVYAAGDVAETRNLFGEWEPVYTWYSAIAQGWVAGCNMMGLRSAYDFCPPLMALKKLEFPVVSIGNRRGDGYELLSRQDKRRGVLEEMYIRDGYVECYQAVGEKDKTGLIFSFIKNRKPIGKFKSALLSPSFNVIRMIS
jgi:NAD(P)H-nitrite reductase large subunit